MSLRSALVVMCVVAARLQAQVHADGSIFKSAATPARAVSDLAYLVLAVCAAIFVIVGGLMLYTMHRFRQRGANAASEPAQVYGSTQIEIAWTVIPILIVLVLTMATARVVTRVQD